MANHLAHETSPYLLQHADNPVDWYPWGEVALRKARQENKPIFLSIGYSACHWCHVMAHESFENDLVAELLNQHFVSIKVDREERPDLDQIYMTAVQAMTGSGGWPMSVFLTPEGKPFYAGTYFPPQPRYGMPSFADVLRAIVAAWRDRREELLQSSEHVFEIIHRNMAAEGETSQAPPNQETLDAAFAQLLSSFDAQHGGWGGAPKFPQPMVLEFLLRYHHTTGNDDALRMATTTLDAMARGGMYDQLGGGFHRYSVDDHWLVPHFEKMLYDNAQLARVYLHAWQVTGNPFYRAITEETLDYVMREMTDPQGGFYSTQDADSEGEEGRFYLWTVDQVWDVLDQDAPPFVRAYEVTSQGNFEGRTILHLVDTVKAREALRESRRRLWQARETRVHPGRDEKVLTAWNGLMLAAFAEAARALNRDDGSRALATSYRVVAERNADFLLSQVRQGNGRLLRTWKAHPEHGEGPGEAKLNGYLEDYAFLIDGLLELYQTTFDPRWYLSAQELAETMITRFQAPAGGFYDTSDDHEALITRPRDLQDNATPSGSAMAITVLLKLAGFTHLLRYVDIAHAALAQTQAMMAQYPLAFGQWLQALSYTLSQPREIAIVGDPAAADTQALLSVVRSGYRPFQVAACGCADVNPSPVPLLQDRSPVEGQPTAAYVCRNFACQMPVTSPEELRAQLAAE